MARVEFRLLGPVEVVDRGRPVPLGGPRAQSIVVALLLEANQVVSVDRLVDAAWGDDPPSTARVQAQNRVSQLRRALGPEGGESIIATTGGGYRIRVGDGQLDLHRFEQLTADADALSADGDGVRALEALAEALSLWRGPPLGGLCTPSLAAAAQRLEESRVRAQERRVEIGLAVGRHAELLPELAVLTRAHPYRERLWEFLMLARYRAGRQADALQTYRETRAMFAEQLGVEPGPALRRLHEAILHGDDRFVEARTTGAVVPTPVTQPSRPVPVPRQLPGEVSGFTGRSSELAALDALLVPGRGGAAPAVVVAIAGMAGVGKTTLAVHWAHRVADRFPDGQLYVNLRGFDPVASPMDPAEAVRGFLEASGIAPDRVPAGLAEQVGRYRSLLAGRRVLVVLDNARDSEQVRPLLPGSPGCLAVVTSRDQLTGLVATDGARPMRLDLLSPVEARQLLERRLGADRVGAEPAAVDEIISRCARLPLALAVVAARAATYPDFTLPALAAQIRAAGDGLDAFAGGEARTDLRAVFSWSYDGLGADAARLFRLLGLHAGPDIGGSAVASLAGVELARVGSLLAELTRAQLVTEHAPGRYTLHDLLRAYAAELAGAVETEPARRAAIRRVVDHYLHTAHAADRLLKPHHLSIDLAEPEPGVTTEELGSQQEALEWFTAEHGVLVAAVDQTASAGLDTHTWQLARVLGEFLTRQGHWHDQLDTERAAVAAAQRLADRAGQAQAHRSLARACLMMGRYEQARIHFQQALDQHAELGDRAGQAIVQLGLARVAEVDDRLPDAFDHSRLALELFRDTDHHSGRAAALNAVGWYAARLGDYQQAVDHCRQALALSQQIGFRHAQAAVWDSLGYTHRQLGDHREATACYQQALRLYREAGDRYNEAEVLTHLGDMNHAAGDPEAARDGWRQAMRILDELGHPDADQLRAKLQ